jgi:hypothetical protein
VGGLIKHFFPIGTKFERLTVIGPAYIELRGTVDKPRRLRCYPCECSCGTKKGIPTYELTSGRTRSCGCLHQELRPLIPRTHGECRTRLHSTWNNLLSRCRAKEGLNFKNYVQRGIVVCDEWRLSFVAFRDWALANGYREGLTIERKNNDLGYSPENCIWIPGSRQARNRRNVRWVEYLGETKNLTEWGSDPRCAVRLKTFLDRIKQRWSFERAFLTPKTRA